MCNCEGPSIQWIRMFFYDCVWSTSDQIAFTFSLISLLLFAMAMMPQLYKNYKRQEVEGLSLPFLTIWVLGDLSNLAGAVLTGQVPPVQYIAAYFILTDIVTLLQYWYYSSQWFKRRRGQRGIEGANGRRRIFEEYVNTDNSEHGDLSKSLLADIDSDDHETIRSTRRKSLDDPASPNKGRSQSAAGSLDFYLNDVPVSADILPSFLPADSPTPVTSSSSSRPLNSYSFHLIFMIISLIINGAQSFTDPMELEISSSSGICGQLPNTSRQVEILGYTLAWLSGILYFFSRIPQIHTNYKLKNVDGLSISLFVLTLSANISYALGILIRFPRVDEKFFASTLPFVIGSAGTLIFDAVIIWQYFMFSSATARLRRRSHAHVLSRDSRAIEKTFI